MPETAMSCISILRRPDIRRRSWSRFTGPWWTAFMHCRESKTSASARIPMEDNNWGEDIQVQGQPLPNKGASWVRANAEFFDSVGTRVVMGRGIALQDTYATRAVAVVNEAFVKNFFQEGSSPIGEHFGSPGPVSSGDYEIVGGAEATVYPSLRLQS